MRSTTEGQRSREGSRESACGNAECSRFLRWSSLIVESPYGPTPSATSALHEIHSTLPFPAADRAHLQFLGKEALQSARALQPPAAWEPACETRAQPIRQWPDLQLPVAQSRQWSRPNWRAAASPADDRVLRWWRLRASKRQNSWTSQIERERDMLSKTSRQRRLRHHTGPGQFAGSSDKSRPRTA